MHGHGQVADHNFLRTGIEKSARGIARRFACGLFQFFVSDAEGLHPQGIRLYLHLLDAAAHVQDLGNARNALQARPHHPIGKRANFARRHGLVRAAQTHEKDFAHQRGDRREKRFDTGRQRAANALKALLHELAGAVDVRTPAKLGVHQREADVGIGAQPGETSHTHERPLNGNGDIGLNLLGRQTRRFGKNDDGGLGEVG